MKNRTWIYLLVAVVVIYFVWKSSQTASNAAALPTGSLPTSSNPLTSLLSSIPGLSSSSGVSNIFGNSPTVAYGDPASDDSGDDD